MYPFYVDKKREFSFSYKPDVGDIIKDDVTANWYLVTEVSKGKGRKIYGRRTVPLEHYN